MATPRVKIFASRAACEALAGDPVLMSVMYADLRLIPEEHKGGGHVFVTRHELEGETHIFAFSWLGYGWRWEHRVA